MAPTIREATLGDVPAIVAMGVDLLTDAYAALITPNAASLRATTERLVSGESTVVLVLERDGVLVGMIGAFFLPEHPMSGRPTASEVMWWVRPDARGAGLRLYRAFLAWATARGAQDVQMIAPSRATEQLYERLGFVAVERTYQRRLP